MRNYGVTHFVQYETDESFARFLTILDTLVKKKINKKSLNPAKALSVLTTVKGKAKCLLLVVW